MVNYHKLNTKTEVELQFQYLVTKVLWPLFKTRVQGCFKSMSGIFPLGPKRLSKTDVLPQGNMR